MAQEDKELLLKDLCARLPYKCIYSASRGITHWNKLTLNIDTITKLLNNEYDEIKPYLRPESSMTKEERGELWELLKKLGVAAEVKRLDWLIAHHFDIRNLIEKGLAIAVTEENNPYKS